MEQTKWPEGFADIGGKTFDWVREHKHEWVDFTLNEMDSPSGLFLKWKTYLLNRKHAKERVLQPACHKTSQSHHENE